MTKAETRKARKFAHQTREHARFLAGDYRTNAERKLEYQTEPVLYVLECAWESQDGRYFDDFDITAFSTPTALVQWLKLPGVVTIHGIYERVKA